MLDVRKQIIGSFARSAKIIPWKFGEIKLILMLLGKMKIWTSNGKFLYS